MHRSSPLAAIAALALVACGDESRSTAPTVPPALPLAALADGRGGGNPDFFFLPPLAADPALLPAPSPYDADAFSPAHQPAVQVCALPAPVPALDPGPCADPVVTLSGAAVKLDVASQQYAANWNTDPATWPPAVVYRIRVLSGGVQLGYVDVSASGADALMSDGRSIPVKFRIERGVFDGTDGPGSPDYNEAFITNDGGRLMTLPKYAGADFSRGWLNAAGLPGVFVTIERLKVGPGGGCHPVGDGLVQYEGCYRYRTFPDVATFSGETPVVVAMCNLVPTPVRAARRLFKSDVGEATTALDEVPTTLFEPGGLACQDYPSSGAAQFGAATLRDRVDAGWRQLARALGRALSPRPLYAIDLGAGGRTFSFSNIGYGVRVTPVALDPPSQVLAGSTVPVRIQVTAPHDHGEDEPERVPVPGLTVTFAAAPATLSAAATPAGSAASLGVTTDAEGKATAYWTLPTASATPYTLTATVAGVQETVQITALSAGSTSDKNRWTMVLTPQRASARRFAKTTFTATLTNPSQQTLPGQPIVWTYPLTNLVSAEAQTTLNENGFATLVIAYSAVTKTPLTITAKGGPVTGTASLTIADK